MEKLGEEIWCEAQSLRLMGSDMGTRMTVLRLGGDLLLHSPVRIDDALAEELERLGRVRWLVAPNAFHHLFVPRAKKRWPDAEVLVAPGVEKKQKALKIDGVLPEAPASWRGVVETHLVPGMPQLNEVVFLHRPSGTLLLTDYLFNFGETDGWWQSVLLGLAGARGGPKQSRLTRFAVRDRPAMKESRDAILGWDFDRATVTHGDVIASGAKDALARATAWLG